MLTALLLCLGAAVATDHADDANLYKKSLIAPPLFKFCKTAHAVEAPHYDAALSSWVEKHQHAIARGEFAVRERAINGTDDIDAEVHGEVRRWIAETGALPSDEQQRRCASLRDEVRVAE